MTTAVCACGQPVTGSTICGLCLGQLRDALRAITGTPGSHGLAVDLDLALSRQGSRGGAKVDVRNPNVLPFDQRASSAAVELRGVLARTVSLLVAGRAAPPYDIAAMAGWLHDHLARFRQHDRASEMATMILDAVDRARRAVDLPPERVYAGPCAVCGTPLYVRPGVTTVGCERRHLPWSDTVEARRDWMLSQVTDHLANSQEASRLLEHIGVDMPDSTIRKYAARARIVAHGSDPKGRPRYRLGDILEASAKAGRS